MSVLPTLSLLVVEVAILDSRIPGTRRIHGVRFKSHIPELARDVCRFPSHGHSRFTEQAIPLELPHPVFD